MADYTGTAGPDTYSGTTDPDTISGLSGDDILNGAGGDDVIDGGDDNDTLRGQDGADHLIGGQGNDTLIGGFSTSPFPQPGDAADHLEGGLGADVLRGGDGDDWLEGGDDDDNLRGDAGSDTMDGGAGSDFVSYILAPLGAGIFFNAANFGATATFTVADPLGGTDTVSNVEKLGVAGTAFNDTIRGSNFFVYNQLFGDAGNDTITGGAIGDDNIDGGTGDDNLRGEGGNDTLVGGDGSDFFRGGAGVDSFDGGSEDPLSTTFGNGSFGDRISFFELAATQGVIANLMTGVIANDGFGNVETMTGIESLGGDTAFVDTFDGNDVRNLILASSGDTVRAWGDDDVIQLGGAAALLDGGLGTDTLNLVTLGSLLPDSNGDGLAETGPNMTAGWTINLQGNFFQDGFGDSGTVLGIENVNGTEFGDGIFGNGANNVIDGGDGGDTLRGNNGDDTLIGGGGNDLLRGGAGVDSFDGGAHTLSFDGNEPGAFGDRVSFSEAGATQGVSANLATGIISNDGFGNAETMTGIESLGADSAFIDTLHGDDNPNFIWGAVGDFLHGHGDDDHMQLNGAAAIVDGGAGIDMLTVTSNGYLLPDSNADGFAETSPAMTAGWQVNLQSGFVIDGFGGSGGVAGIENVTGAEYDDFITGNASDNLLDGGDGNDIIRGRDGADHLIGGNGNDQLAGGFNTSPGPQLGDLADHLEGGTGNDLLRGGDGDDVLEGGDDDDNLRGDAGNDVMDGGAGRDFVSYLYSTLAAGITLDGRAYGATTTFTVVDAFGGTDTVSNVEALGLAGTEFDDTIWGSLHFVETAPGFFANQMSGFGGNDVIHGAAHADSLNGDGGSDTLDAGGGDDALTGGAGDDDLDGGTGDDTAFFHLAEGAVGTLSVVAGTGPDAGKQLVLLTDGAAVTRIAEITVSGAVVTVTGLNDGAAFGIDTVTNVQQLVFLGDFSDPTGPAQLSVDVADVTGVVSDGYVAGATIFIDKNGNQQLDPGEFSTVSDANGKFTLPELGAGNLVAIGGVNIDTGLANELVLTAPNGAAAINPLTTLVHAIVEQDGVDAVTAEAQLLAALGLDPGLDLLNSDLIAAAEGGDADALAAQQAAVIVATILTAAEDAAGGAAGAEADAVAELAGLISDGSVDLTDPEVIEQVLEAAAPGAGDLGVIADQVADSAEQIAEADSLDEIADAQTDAMLTGNDLANALTGSNADDELEGLGGNDLLVGGLGADLLDGGAGFDTASYRNAAGGVSASLGARRGTAGEANGDRFTSIEGLEGSAFGDTLSGSNADDHLAGLAGNDNLSGDTGDDLVDGGDGNDTLSGGNQDDLLVGGDGNDALDGGNQDDVLDGGNGNDSLVGGNQNDILSGGDGDDSLDGGNQDDILSGGAGNDTLVGGHQNDVLNGGAGNDVMTGGNQKDVFRFTETGGADVITDFKRGDDKIDLAAIDAKAGGADNAFSWIGANAFTGVAGQLRAYSQSGSHWLAGDVNGDGLADFAIRTNILVVASDIVL